MQNAVAAAPRSRTTPRRRRAAASFARTAIGDDALDRGRDLGGLGQSEELLPQTRAVVADEDQILMRLAIVHVQSELPQRRADFLARAGEERPAGPRLPPHSVLLQRLRRIGDGIDGD